MIERASCRLEVEQGARLAGALIKRLPAAWTRISVRDLYKGNVDFEPTFSIWIAGQRRPVVSSDDDGTWSRLKELPFPVSFSARRP